MTMSKKFLTMAVLTLAMQFNAQAYDTTAIKAEVSQIVDFVQELGKDASAQAKNTAKRLKKIVKKWTSKAADAKESAEQAELIRSVKKIINSKKTNEEKIARLLEIMPEEESRLAVAYDTTKKTIYSWRVKIANAIAPTNE